MKTFKCNVLPSTDSIKAFIRHGDGNISVQSKGNLNGSWTRTIVLTPQDAAEMGGELLDLAAKQGVHVSWIYNGDEEEVEMFHTQETKVTAEQIDAIMKKAKVLVSTEFEKCTVVTVKLPNGFTITESSGCVDVANYDVKLGTEICLKKIRNKVWELEGYTLQKRLSDMGVM